MLSRTRNATRLKDILIGNAPLLADDADYDPTIAGASPVIIEFDLNLISITELSAIDESFVIETWWRHWWRGERLTWDPAAFGGVGKLMLDTAEVWYPDIAAWVLLEEPMPTMKNKAKLEVNSDGQLFISTPRRDVSNARSTSRASRSTRRSATSRSARGTRPRTRSRCARARGPRAST